LPEGRVRRKAAIAQALIHVGTLDADGHAAFSLVLPAGAAGGLIGETLTVAADIATAGGKLVAGSSRVELSVEP
jgi:hypothetical protein